MKFLNKLALIIFSWIILIISVITCMIMFGWINVGQAEGIIAMILGGSTSSKIVLGVCIVFILLAIKCIFFSSYSSNETIGQGVLLENENGKLMISKETLENLVVSTDAVIKDLSSNLQNKIKEKIKSATDLEVKEVNIKVKNVAPKKEENL